MGLLDKLRKKAKGAQFDIQHRLDKAEETRELRAEQKYQRNKKELERLKIQEKRINLENKVKAKKQKLRGGGIGGGLLGPSDPAAGDALFGNPAPKKKTSKRKPKSTTIMVDGKKITISDSGKTKRNKSTKKKKKDEWSPF